MHATACLAAKYNCLAAKIKYLADNNKPRTENKADYTTSLHPGHPPPPRSADRGRVKHLLR